ncbi:MAG: hypothetical protein K2Y12_12710 [Chitinophagaceae bacterium]|jgi:hypothetical protein|nr:hypothetical protein [Chitinophagaceae bacterium]
MEYNLQYHGDHLERSYFDFIQTYFKTYEAVWKIFIGNKGDDTKADIEGYSTEKNIQRQKFSEHTYTILQSLILLKRLIDKGAYSRSILNTTEDILDLQDNLLLFFTHLGRITNNVEEASALLGLKETETSNLLKEFYHKRHILVHGKMLPIIFKSEGEILIPVLSKNGTDLTGWYHKEHSWLDIVSLPTLEVGQTASKLFWDLLPKLEEIFGVFKKVIEADLGKQGLKLKFEHNIHNNIQGSGSGSFDNKASNCGIVMYGLNNINKTKW